MYRKITSLLLAGIISVLLITGCSSGKEDLNVSNTDTTQTEAQTGEEGTSLPSESGIGILYVPEEGEFTEAFIKKLEGYLLSAGVSGDRIEIRSGSSGEIADMAKEMTGSGCNALVAGNISEDAAQAVTNAASKAGIPVLFFGTDPGEKETQRWEKKKIRAAYVGGSFLEAAAKRADVLEGLGLENTDLNEDEEIGLIVMGSEEEKPGDVVNSETIRILEDRGFTLNVFEEPGSGEDEEDAEEADAEEEEDDAGEEAAAEEETAANNAAEEAAAEEEAAANNAAEEAAEDEETEEEASDAENAEEEMTPWEQEARDRARDLMISYMDEYGREIEVVMCSSDAQALGVVDAVNEEKRKVGHDVVILGFDCIPDSLREVAAGRIVSTFFDNFLEQSKTASDMVLAMLRGEIVNTRSMSEFVSVTVDNAQEILDISMSVQDEDPGDEEEEDTEEDGDTENAEEAGDGEQND